MGEKAGESPSLGSRWEPFRKIGKGAAHRQNTSNKHDASLFAL